MTLTDVLQTREEYFKKITVKNEVKIDNQSGIGFLEVGGTTGAYIDLKSPFSDDYDVRLITNGTSTTLETRANQPLTISSGTGNVNIQPNASGKVGIGVSSPTEKLEVVGNIKSNGKIQAQQGAFEWIEVGSTTNAFIDIKNPDSDDYDVRLGTLGSGGYINTNNANFEIAALGTGKLRFINLPTYTNNAAAIAGGLAVNDVYKTATGELRIVV